MKSNLSCLQSAGEETWGNEVVIRFEESGLHKDMDALHALYAS